MGYYSAGGVGQSVEGSEVTTFPFTLTNATTENALVVDQNGNVGTAVATDGALHIENTGNTGIGLGVYTNIGAADAELVSIKANNTAFDKSILLITDNSTAAHESITLNTSMAGAQNIIDITASGAFTTGAVLKARATSASATGQGITIENAGTGDGLFVDNNNSGIATNIDHDVTNKNMSNSSLQVDYKTTVNDAATYTRTGAIVSITASVTETSGTITDTAILLDLNQTHTDASGVVVDLDNYGAGATILGRDAGTQVWSVTDKGEALTRVLVEANVAGVGSPNIIAPEETSTHFTNEGVTAKNYHTLPTAVAGYRFTFYCQDADGVRVVANTGDTIRLAATASGAAGYTESTTIGSAVTLVAINATEWVATSIIGTWDTV